MNKTTAISCIQGLLALLILCGIWLALPARWLWVDIPGTLLGLGCAAAAGAKDGWACWPP